MILNLKKLNTFVDSPHFKMDSIRNVISMVQKGVWMASVDLKDAFFTMPINVHDQKYLKFIWDRPYAFAAIPNGYFDAMRVFIKIFKPAFTVLRQSGHLSCVCVDDSHLHHFNLRSLYLQPPQSLPNRIQLQHWKPQQQSALNFNEQTARLHFILSEPTIRPVLAQVILLWKGPPELWLSRQSESEK